MKGRLIKILDTTLRDGQQCPGAGMTWENNIAYAHLAAQLGIDILEAGFPSASQSEFQIVNSICQELVSYDAGPTVAALCQLREEQIDLTIQALLPLQPSRRARLHTYLPVDPALMQASLGHYAEDRLHIISEVYRLIKKAAEAGLEVEFSPEGYSRIGDNFDFATDVIRAAIEGGATIINCPDTIGGACPLQGKAYFVFTMKRHAEIFKKEFPHTQITWSTHCHNDFGLALINSMQSIFQGPATQVEGCMNGLGERAGNAALEQCIMYIKHFGQYYSKDEYLYTNIKTQQLKPISDFVSNFMLPRQPHWPITGENSAKHTSGGHTNAILHNPLAYQPFLPQEVGNEISFLFGPSSGGNHAKSIIEQFGYRCDNHEKVKITQFIKDIYKERRKGITDTELFEGYLNYRNPVRIDSVEYERKGNFSQLTLHGKFFDIEGSYKVSLEGNDSSLAALHYAIEKKYPGIKINNYTSESISRGIHAVSKSTIYITDHNNKNFKGVGEDRDIEISALKALVDAVNQSYVEHHFKI